MYTYNQIPRFGTIETKLFKCFAFSARQGSQQTCPTSGTGATLQPFSYESFCLHFAIAASIVVYIELFVPVFPKKEFHAYSSGTQFWLQPLGTITECFTLEFFFE